MNDCHAVAAAPHARAKAGPLAGFGRVQTFTSLSSLRTFDEQTLQLSERDSIFATTYFASESNAATPRQSPIKYSKNDSARHVESDLQLPPWLLCEAGPSASSVPAAAPAQAHFSPTMTPHSALTYQLQRSRPGTVTVRDRQHDAKALYLSQMNDNHGATESDFISSEHLKSSLIASDPRPPNAPRSRTAYHLRMSAQRNASEGTAQGTARRSTAELGGSEKLAAENDRAHSKYDEPREAFAEGQGQQIEAVIASEDPAHQARSRKASHYLGIFKENKDGRDWKKGKEKQQENKIKGQRGSQDTAGLRDGRESSKATSSQGQRMGHNSTHHRRGSLDYGQGKTDSVAETSGFTGSSTHATAALPPAVLKDSTLMIESEDDLGLSVKEGVEWRSENNGHGSFPLRLLEEIRDHRRSQKVKEPTPSLPSNHRPVRTSSQYPSDVDAVGNRSRSASPSENEAQTEDDEGYSDKERISSATYYPHQAPSPDTVAEHHHLDESQMNEEKSKLSQLPAQTLDRDLMQSTVIRKSTNSAFNLQSKDRIRYVETEYHGVHIASDSAEKSESRWSVASSASDTDYESAEDAGRSDKDSDHSRIDDGDVTPTPTPRSYSYVRSRQRRGRKPLQAVELQPYKHQVGGHTKVFSFSKQAICKQLNNRENVFYEIIEREHRQLLPFLPKSVAHLPNLCCVCFFARHSRWLEADISTCDLDISGFSM